MINPAIFGLAAVMIFSEDLVLAKRIPPPNVPPIAANGNRYVAPNGDGTRGDIEAWDVQKGSKLWEAPQLKKMSNGYLLNG